jgi:hypothetical protein
VADPKPFASLSSNLLARKGAARPAMRPQGFGQVGNGLEDLGWDDMGHESPKPTGVPRDVTDDAFDQELGDEQPRIHHPTGLTPVQSPVHDQQAVLADRLGVDPEDEDFDETAELYDPNAPDASETDEPEVDEFETDEAEEAEAVEVPALEIREVRPPKVQALPIREAAEEEEPFELTERFDEFDPFEQAEEGTAPEAIFPPPTASTAFEPASGYEPVATYSPLTQPTPRAAPGSKAKAAFTLRLDPDRHLKLRLACAVNGRSAQQIVTDAVDQLLRQMPELDAMAEKAKRKG